MQIRKINFLITCFIFLLTILTASGQNNYFKNIIEAGHNSADECIKTHDNGLLLCSNTLYGLNVIKLDSGGNFVDALKIFNGGHTFDNVSLLENQDSSIFLITNHNGSFQNKDEIVLIKLSSGLNHIWHETVLPDIADSKYPYAFFTKNSNGITDGIVICYYKILSSIYKSVVVKVDLNGSVLWKRIYRHQSMLILTQGTQLLNGDLLFSGHAMNDSTTYAEGVVLCTDSIGVKKYGRLFDSFPFNHTQSIKAVQNPTIPSQLKLFCLSYPKLSIHKNKFGFFINLDSAGNIINGKKFTSQMPNGIVSPYFTAGANNWYVTGECWYDTLNAYDNRLSTIGLLDNSDSLISYKVFGDTTGSTLLNVISASGNSQFNQQITAAGKTTGYGVGATWENTIARFNFSNPPCYPYFPSISLDTINPSSHPGITDTAFFVLNLTGTQILSFVHNTLAVGDLCLGVNVENYSQQQSVSVYPNPCSNFCTVNFTDLNSDVMQLEIFDVSGKVVLVKKIGPGEKLDLSVLSDGVYVLTVFSNQSVFRTKLIKQAIN